MKETNDMKFLPQNYIREHMMPINIMYHDPGFKDMQGKYMSDLLTIVYKDQDTGEKIIYEIKDPEIEIFITKPELRNYEHMRDMFDMKDCDRYKVRYRSRWFEASKKLGLETPREAKVSPYVFNADIPIETYYLTQFILEYPSDMPKKLSLGKLDIENDIIQYANSPEFPAFGEVPINAVTYINMETNDVYTLLLLKDNLPELTESNSKYQRIQEMKKHFYEQVEQIKADPGIIERKSHEKFDELYPGMKYNILYYEDERKLLSDLMSIIHQTDNEYIGIWNSPYDMQHIMSRPLRLGMSPNEIIPDNRFSLRLVGFKEDKNPSAKKRKHECTTYTIPTFTDDMVLYDGIHSGGGVIPSLKLNAIGKRELKDAKYDYSEVSDIAHLFYDNLIMFTLYNIKDVLLLVGIENKTNDMTVIYSRMYQMCVFPRESFTTTKVVWHSLIKFMYENGIVPGTNRNRGNKTKTIIDYASILSGKIDSSSMDLEGQEFDIEEEPTEGEDEESKNEKYEGAYVMNPLHMLPTSMYVNGVESKYIHNGVADSDVGSEYPTSVIIGNMSNETLVGKVVLEQDDDLKVEIPTGFTFKGNEREDYKLDKSNFLLESYTEGDTFSFASQWLNLPTVETIFDRFEEKFAITK